MRGIPGVDPESARPRLGLAAHERVVGRCGAQIEVDRVRRRVPVAAPRRRTVRSSTGRMSARKEGARVGGIALFATGLVFPAEAAGRAGAGGADSCLEHPAHDTPRIAAVMMKRRPVLMS